jgi:sugar lactone lactonase YvrE
VRREGREVRRVRNGPGTIPVYKAAPAAKSQAELGESPLWEREVGLRWLDVTGRRLFGLGLDGSETSLALSGAATCIELGPGGDLFAVTPRGFGWLSPTTGRIDEVVTVLEGEGVSMNDGAIDPLGRYWAGSAVRDGSRRGALFCLDGTVVTVRAEDIGMSNGIDWSPAGDVLYHVDTAAGTVTAWEYDLSTGQLAAPRVLRSVPAEVGLPDGLTVDADGNIWLAIWGLGHVWRLDPHTGKTTAVVEVATPYATSCVFGGSDLSTLYITTATHVEPPGGGLLHAVEVRARGRHPYRFAGVVR